MIGLGFNAAQVFAARKLEHSALQVWQQDRMLSNAQPDLDPDLGGLLPRIIPSAAVFSPYVADNEDQYMTELVELPVGPNGRKPLLMFVSRTNCGW